MKTTILIILVSLLWLTSCNGKKKQTEPDSPETEEVDTNKIYEIWEIDTPPVMP